MRDRLRLGNGCQLPLLRVMGALFLTISIGISGLAAVEVYPPDELNQESSKKLLKRAKKLLRKGLYSESAVLIKKVLEREPDNNKASLDLAYIYLKQKRTVAAYEIAFRVAKDDPKDSFAFAILGAVYLAAGNFTDARLLLVNSLNLNKREALAWASLGLLEFYENKLNESVLNLEDAVYHDNKEPDFLYALAQVSARNERYRKSAEAYKRFLRIAPDSDKERRDRIRGLIRFLNYLGKKSRIYSLAGNDRTTVPMEIVNNRPIVEVKFDKDGPPRRFVLDTGSGMTVISEETAKRFKVKSVARGGLARALGGDGKFEIVYGFLDDVRIGDVRIRNVPTYIRKFPESSTTVDGYIGISLLSQFITTIDYGKSTFTLVRKDEYEDGAENPQALTIPLRLTSSGFLSGNVTLTGVESDFYFILDTGASVSVVSNDLAAKDEIRKNKTDQLMRVIGAAGVTENVPLFMLKGLYFGGIEAPDLRAVALDLDLINESAGFQQAGIIGGNFLRDYSLTFDFKRSKVVFVPN